MDSIIRKATLADLETVVTLFEAYRAFYKCAPDESSARAFIKERMLRTESVVFLAECTSGVVGFMQLFPSFTSAGLARIWILNDLYVDPESRRHGIAGKLLSAAAAFSKETGSAKLILSTALTNAAAQALYTQLGWERDTEYLTYVLRTSPI